MKLVRTSGEFGQPGACYIYRQLTGNNKTDMVVLENLSAIPPANEQAVQSFVYRADAELNGLINQLTEAKPDYTSVAENNLIVHQIWSVKGASCQSSFEKKLEQLPACYPLNSWVSPQGNPGDPRTLLLIAGDQLKPLPCHRLLADLAGMDDYEFLQRLQKCFNIRVASGARDATPHSEREFGLYVAGYWYHLRLIEGTWFHADPVSDLDVSIVHDNMIAPMLGITDRNDPRVGYTAGDCSLATLQQQVDSGQWQAIWLMPAPTVAQLMHISDLGRSMPSHSVHFAPLVDPAVFAGLAVSTRNIR